MSPMSILRGEGPVLGRVGAAALVGVLAAAVCIATGEPRFAPPIGWTVAAAVYVGWTWLLIGRMDPARTQQHATREDPSRHTTDVILTLACFASLAGVGYVLAAGSTKGSASVLSAAAGIVSVVSAWFVLHTVFALRYASLYYRGRPGGIDFNSPGDASYLDFAYVAFTLGMTYQVSDTELTRRQIRATALRHALLSYFFGVVVVATMINLVVSLGSSGG